MNLKSLFLTLLFVCPSLLLALPSLENETMWKEYASKTEASLLPAHHYNATTVADVVSTTERLGFIFVIENNQQTQGMYWCLSDNTLYALSDHEKKLIFLSDQPHDLVTKYGVSEAAVNDAEQRIHEPLPTKKWSLSKKIAAATLGVVSVVAAYYFFKWCTQTQAPVQPKAPEKDLEIFHGPFRPYDPLKTQRVKPGQIVEELVGEKIILRKLQKSDVAECAEMMSPETIQEMYVDGKSIVQRRNFNSKDFVSREISYNFECMNTGRKMSYAIIDKETGKIIGGINAVFDRSMYAVDDSPDTLLSRSSILSRWLNKDYRGGGRIQEALKLFSGVFFDITGEKRMSSVVRVENIASRKSLEKAGFSIVDHVFPDRTEFGRRSDSYILELQKG